MEAVVIGMSSVDQKGPRIKWMRKVLAENPG